MKQQYLSFITIIKSILHSETCEISAELDWTLIVELAKEQNLLALVLEEAVKHSSYLERTESEKEKRIATGVVAGQTKRTQAFLQLYKEFVKNDLYPIVMKGLICRKLYGKLEDHRPSGDEDILIHPKEYAAMKAILIANGYLPKFE